MASEKQLAALSRARAAKATVKTQIRIAELREVAGGYQEPDELDREARNAPPVRTDGHEMSPEQLQARSEDFASAPTDAAAKKYAALRVARTYPARQQLLGTSYVVGRKPLKIPGGITLQPGEIVPDAANWPRLEGYVRTGVLKAVA